MRIDEYRLGDFNLRTGDLICTADGEGGSVIGKFWWYVGKLIPGEVDHIAIYTGPGGRCVEAGARGVVVDFELKNNVWDASAMTTERGPLIDVLKGVVSPLSKLALAPDAEVRKRRSVADYCLRQRGKPYNLNFLNSSTEKAFYCSQLAYKAYRRIGIDLNTNRGVACIPGTEPIVFPEEIWKTWRK